MSNRARALVALASLALSPTHLMASPAAVDGGATCAPGASCPRGLKGGTAIGTQNNYAPPPLPPSPPPVLFIDCVPGIEPRTMPASGRYFDLEIQGYVFMPGNEGVPQGFATIFGGPGGDLYTNNRYSMGYRCDVYNYGSQTLTNVTILMHGNFGKLSATMSVLRDLSVTIPKIDPGLGNQFTFYVHDMSEYAGELVFDPAARAVPVGAMTAIDVPLQQQDGLHLFVYPPLPALKPK